MKLFKMALEKQKWDFVAHTIIFATANFLNKGGDADACKNRRKSKRNGKQSRQQ
ncbi:MAG: hypothetical protein PHR56_03450 [Dehalococcoidales bacterium]|nr:hypothetical protein [Dehalococcoidales bacterium]